MANVGEEPRCPRRLLVEDLVAAVSVGADGRRRYQHRRAVLQASHARDEISCAEDPAVADAGLLAGRPATFRHRLARQVKHRLAPVKRLGGRRGAVRNPTEACGLPKFRRGRFRRPSENVWSPQPCADMLADKSSAACDESFFHAPHPTGHTRTDLESHCVRNSSAQEHMGRSGSGPEFAALLEADCK